MPDRFKPGTRRSRVGLYFGRRGSILLLFGLAFIMIGFGFATIQMDRFSRPGPGGPLEFMDDTPWPGIFWIICGVVAVTNGLIRRRIKNEDAPGYAALVMPPALWTVAYIWSSVSWVYTRLAHWPYEYGRQTGFIGAGAFGMIALVLLIISHWRDDLDEAAPTRGSTELALLDAMVETKQQNDARGDRARAASERWIGEARLETERHIQASGKENDRMIAAAIDEVRRNDEDRRNDHVGDRGGDE